MEVVFPPNAWPYAGEQLIAARLVFPADIAVQMDYNVMYEASNIVVKLVKDMTVMKFNDRASFQAPRVVARSVDGDGEETPAAADGQFEALGQSAALVDALDALRAALLEKK